MCLNIFANLSVEHSWITLFSCLFACKITLFPYFLACKITLFSILTTWKITLFSVLTTYKITLFSLFLSFEVFCRLITEVEEWRNWRCEEDALKCREGECLNGSYQRHFTVPVRPEVKAFFAMPRLQGGAKVAKFMPLCTQKGRRRKNINRNRARGARIHLSYLYVFQGYMHFLQTLHSWGLKFDNQRG